MIDEEDIFTKSRNPNFTRYISSSTNEFLEELVFKWASTVEIPCKYLHKKFLLIQKITDKWSSNYGQAVSRKVTVIAETKSKMMASSRKLRLTMLPQLQNENAYVTSKHKSMFKIIIVLK